MLSKVVVAAFIGFEVDKFSGSEGGVGFSWLKAASDVCDKVILFTRSDISSESLLSILDLSNVTVVLVSPPFLVSKKNKLEIFERGLFRYLLNIGYRIWLRRVAKIVKQRKFNFDLIHYCTYVGFRFRTGLENDSSPIVRGPVGGLENSSLVDAATVGLSVFMALLFRNVVNTFDRNYSLESWDAMAGKQVTRLISAHQGIQAILQKTYGVKSTCFIECPAISTSVLKEKEVAEREYNCVVVWNGSPQKRVALAAWAVLLAKCDIRLDVFGPPISVKDLPRAAIPIFSKDKIRCHGYVERKRLIDFMGKSTFFATFSLKDLSSVSLIEALSAGLIPIVSDNNGFKFLVDHTRGRVCQSGGGYALAIEASNFFDLLFDMPLLRDLMHKKNSQWISDNFSEEKLVSFLRNEYEDAIKNESV